METRSVEGRRTRGRGAGSNAAGRHEALRREWEDDGWDAAEDLPPLRTEVADEQVRRAISRNGSPDVPFDRSLNPYRGCEHGCIYCFARPTHAWLGLSPGLDFETRLVARPNAPEALERELRARGYHPAPLALGTNTDPYQPIEGRYRIMRRILEVMRAYRHPISIATKGTLIERDLDLLGALAEAGLVNVGVTVTTLDATLARALEPRVPPPARRLGTIERLSAAGVPVRVMLSPVIPGLTDHELERILAAAHAAGARAASWAMLRLPLEVAALFREWLAEHRPDRARRVMAQVREVHGGRDYDPEWGRRMKGQGVQAQLVARRFAVASRRLGLDRGLPDLRTDLFAPPPQAGDQLSLF